MWKDLKDADKFQRFRPGRKQPMDTVRMWIVDEVHDWVSS